MYKTARTPDENRRAAGYDACLKRLLRRPLIKRLFDFIIDGDDE